MKLRELTFELAAGANRQLRGNQNQRAVGKVLQTAAKVFQHKFHVRFLVVINRRVIGRPKDSGVSAPSLRIIGERKCAIRQTGSNQLIQARLENGRFASVELRDLFQLEVQTGHLE